MTASMRLFQTPEFKCLCENHKVKVLYAFGSVASGTETQDSDVDLLVELDESNPIFKGKLILSLYYELEQFFSKKVDLLTVDSINNAVLEEYIETSKKLVYERSRS